MNIRTLTECLDTKLKTEAFEYEFDDELDYIMDDDSLSDEEKEQAISDLYNKYNIDESWSDEDISSIPFSELISGNWFGAKESDYGGTVDKSFFSKWGDTEDTKYSDEDPESLDEDWDDDYYDEDKYSLVGQDGNAFALMGYTAKCMKECGLRDEIEKMREEAMSSDYNNLISVCDSYVQKCNDIARDM